MRLSQLLALGLAAWGCAEAPETPPEPPAEPHAGLPLVGRWLDADRALEFLGDGTLVEYVPYEAEHSIRNEDGTFRKEVLPGFRCSMGRFEPAPGGRVRCELVAVGGLDTWEGAWTWRVDGPTLTLAGDDDQGGTFRRDDTPVPAGARPLLGLWRRTGSVIGDQDLGVRFTPGGLSIVIGRNAQWDNRSATGSVSWLCLAATYSVEDGVLHEASPSFRDRPRARPFTIEGDRLTFGPARVYERVRGVVPLPGGRLDLAAWKAMK